MLLLDNMILVSLARARRLDVLKHLRDATTSERVKAEFARKANPYQKEFEALVKTGNLRVSRPAISADRQDTYDSLLVAFGRTDAELVVWALTQACPFVTDERRLAAVAKTLGVDLFDLVDLLHDLSQAGKYSKEELRRLVNDLSIRGDRKFTPADLEHLGLE